MHDATGNRTDKREHLAKNARRSEKWHGRGGNVGRMARDETGKRHGRGGNVGRMARDETGKRYGGEGNVERVARDGTGSRDSTGGRRLTTSEEAGRSMLADHSNKFN